MAMSQAYKDLVAAGVWAGGASADRATPTELGLTRAQGWPIAYEQIGSGKHPERELFNHAAP